MEKLFTPLTIGNVELKNRFTMAPMENGLAELGTGEVTDRLINYFVERAKNDVAMIFTGSIGVSPEGRGLPTQLSLYDEKHVAGHKRLVDAVHNAGSLINAQIYHAGRQASEAITGLDPLAPSAIPCSILGNHPKEITLAQMEEIKNKFVQSAKWSEEAGYDMVEVHFAHGYLLHSFMSPHSNHRNDEYNGSFENRLKYPMEVLEAVINAVNIPVNIRISVDEYLEDGFKFDEVVKVCKNVEKIGCAAISLTAGCYDAVDYAIQPMYIKQGFIIPFAEKLMKEVNIPVIVAARLNNAKMIEDAVNTGKADAVAIGRGLIADPELIKKIENKDYDNIRYCIACNQGCIDRVLGGMNAHCMVNPCAGQEVERKLKDKTSDKTIAVIGAGPAGLQAALTLNERGYKVNLYSKEEVLGGKMNVVATPPEKESFKIFEEYLINQVKKSNVNVIIKEVKDVNDIEGDEVILATGSTQTMPPIKGIENTKVVFAEDVLKGKVNPKGNVVVIGAGLVGTETSKYLGSKGNCNTTLVEMKDNIADGIGATFIGHMFAKLKEYKVDVKTSATVKEITNDSVLVNDETLKADYVVISTGYKAVNDLEPVLNTKFKVHVIGDAKQARRILDATDEAYEVANNI